MMKLFGGVPLQLCLFAFRCPNVDDRMSDRSLLLSTVDYDYHHSTISNPELLLLSPTRKNHRQDWFFPLCSFPRHFIAIWRGCFHYLLSPKMSRDIKIIISLFTISLDREQGFLGSISRRCTFVRQGNLCTVDSHQFTWQDQQTSSKPPTVQRHYLCGAQHDIQFICKMFGKACNS